MLFDCMHGESMEKREQGKVDEGRGKYLLGKHR